MNAVLRYAADSGDDNMTRCAQWYRHVVLGIVGREWVMRLTETDQICRYAFRCAVFGVMRIPLYMLFGSSYGTCAVVSSTMMRFPSDADPYRRWLTLLNSLDLNGIPIRFILATRERFSSR